MSRPTFPRMMLPLVLLGALATGATAAPITYSTRGSIYSWRADGGGADGRVGPEAVSITAATGGTMTPPGTISLGELVVAPTAGGGATTYNDAAFLIELETSPGDAPVAGGGPRYSTFSIYGALSGTVAADGRSDLTARVLSITPSPIVRLPEDTSPAPVFVPPFPLEALSVATLRVSTPAGGGRATLLARVEVVPEPASIAVFALATAGGLLVHRRRARGRA